MKRITRITLAWLSRRHAIAARAALGALAFAAATATARADMNPTNIVDSVAGTINYSNTTFLPIVLGMMLVFTVLMLARRYRGKGK